MADEKMPELFKNINFAPPCAGAFVFLSSLLFVDRLKSVSEAANSGSSRRSHCTLLSPVSFPFFTSPSCCGPKSKMANRR